MVRRLLVGVGTALLAACSGDTTPPPASEGPEQPAQTSSPAQTATGLPAEVLGATWEWVGFVSPVEELTVDAASRYTVSFDALGRVTVQADCNTGSGGYSIPEAGRIALPGIALTKMACPPGSLSDRFVTLLGRASTWFLRDGAFYLELPVDSGTLRFRRKG